MSGILADRGEKVAVVMAGSGVEVTYSELDARSLQLARLLREKGLQPGDRVAVLLENHPRYFEVYWAAQRTGLYTVPINWHLTSGEAGYIVEDSDASALVTSAALAKVAGDLDPFMNGVKTRLIMDGDHAGFDRYEDAIAGYGTDPLDDQREGAINVRPRRAPPGDPRA